MEISKEVKYGNHSKAVEFKVPIESGFIFEFYIRIILSGSKW